MTEQTLRQGACQPGLGATDPDRDPVELPRLALECTIESNAPLPSAYKESQLINRGFFEEARAQ